MGGKFEFVKLLFCRSCQDVIRLPASGARRACECGKTWGRYLDDVKAEYGGAEAIPIGFDNKSLYTALMHQPAAGRGMVFEAFVIPKKCPTMRVVRGRE